MENLGLYDDDSEQEEQLQNEDELEQSMNDAQNSGLNEQNIEESKQEISARKK